MRKYWLRLDEDLFDRDEMLIIESMLNGSKIMDILLKLYLKTIKSDGKLEKPYELKGYTMEEIEAVMPVFRRLGIIQKTDSGDEFSYLWKEKAGADL